MGSIKKYFIIAFVLLLFVFPFVFGNNYLNQNSEVIKNAVSFLQDSNNIDKFSISVLGFGAMDLRAVNENVPQIYKTKIIKELNDTSVAGLGIAICGLRAMDENPEKIISPKDFNGNGVKENLVTELLNSSIQNNVFSNDLILMGLICSGKMNNLKSYHIMNFILNHQDENGKIGYSMDSHALAVMVLEKYEKQNDDLVPDEVLKRAGEYLLNDSSNDFDKNLSAYGYTWNSFFPSATTTGLALGAISSLNLSISYNPVDFLVKNANYLGFKDNYSSDQSFSNAEAFLGAMGMSYPYIPPAKICKIKLRIEGLNEVKYNNYLNVKCNILEALNQSGVNYSIKQYSFGPFVYAIDNETGNVNKSGGVVYYVDSGAGYEVPNVGMADYELKDGDSVLIAVVNETYSGEYPIPLKIIIDKDVIVKDINDKPVSHAKVYSEEGLIGKTDSGGILARDGLDSGSYHIWAEASPKYIRSEKIKFENSDNSCRSEWSCTEWSECVKNVSTRECFDKNHCGLKSPVLNKKCVSKSDYAELDDMILKVNDTSDLKVKQQINNTINITKENKKTVVKSNGVLGSAIVLAIILLGGFVAKLLKAI